MSAASRTVSTAPGTRQAGAALLAVVLLLAIGAVLAYGSFAAAKPQVPGAGAAPVVHDHGWSTGSGAAGSTSERAAVDAGRHRPKSPVGVTRDSGPAGLVILGARGGAIRYTGIPYPAPATATPSSASGSTGSAASTRIRLAR